MLNCFILFDDATTVGKVSQLTNNVHPGLVIKKILDAKQVKENDDKDILITNESGLDQIRQEGISFKFSIILSDRDEDVDHNVTFVNKKFIVTKIGTLLYDHIQEQIKSVQYVPLSITHFKAELTYPCDLFIKLGQEKYLKIGKANSHMDEKVLQKLIFKGSKYLYLDKNDYSLLLDFLKERQAKLKATDTSQEDIKSVETVHDYITDMGFDPKIVNMTKDLHKNIEEKFNQKFIKSLLAQFQDLQGSFLYNHSYLTSVIALSVGKKFTWMNYDNREKIYLGSILHDLGFNDKSSATFENMSKASLSNLDPLVKEDVLTHPIKFAKQLGQLSEIHQDVIKIVKDHHGVKGEASYPNQIYPNEINLIFALFVLSHEFSLKLYSISFNPKKIEPSLTDLLEEFNRGNFKKIIPEFKQTIEEIFKLS